ncbi:MAG: hypothetical protein ACJ8KU_02065 [Chthoniobacterales bacterium]
MFRAVYIVMALLQAIAIFAGAKIFIGGGGPLLAMVSTVLGFVPVIGSALATIGAVKAWKINVLVAISLFAWYWAFFAVVAFRGEGEKRD